MGGDLLLNPLEDGVAHRLLLIQAHIGVVAVLSRGAQSGTEVWSASAWSSPPIRPRSAS